MKKELSFAGDPGQVRTVDPLIKSQLLYQLSYGVNNVGCKYKKMIVSVDLNFYGKLNILIKIPFQHIVFAGNYLLYNELITGLP